LCDRVGDRSLQYVRTVNLAEDRHFPFEICFTNPNRLHNERRPVSASEPTEGTAGRVVHWRYDRGELKLTFCQTATGGRLEEDDDADEVQQDDN
jgi:hypothetical protein